MIFYLTVIILVIPLFLIYPTRVRGRRNVPRKGRMIFCCNHQSNIDVPLVAVKLIRRRFNYMAKESLFKNKVIGWYLKKLGGYPINRATTDLSAIKRTLGLLKDEKAVCIFPEGARLKTEDQGDLQDGAIIFALKTNSPIVPACIIKKPKPFIFNKMVIGEAFNLSEMEEFKGKKLSPELIAKGKEILKEKMFGLFEKNSKKPRKIKKDL